MNLRHKIARALLKEEVAKLDLERNTYLELQQDLNRKHIEFEEYKASVSIADMVRENLKGFDPKLFDTEEDLPHILGEIEEQDSFLGKVYSLKKNDTINTIINYIIRNQISFSATQAKDLNEINFGRATINGLELFRDEINRLATIYEERHANEPDFDKHDVV